VAKAAAPDRKADQDSLDRANKVCPASRSNSASRVPVARHRSSKVKVAPDHKADQDKPDQDNLDRANQDCRANRSNSANKVPVARHRSSRVKAEPDHKAAQDRKADRDNLDRDNLDPANKVCLASRSNSANRGPAVRSRSSRVAPDQARANLGKAALASQVVKANQEARASRSSSANKGPAASPS
jgi:hypothetical protein